MEVKFDCDGQMLYPVSYEYCVNVPALFHNFCSDLVRSFYIQLKNNQFILERKLIKPLNIRNHLACQVHVSSCENSKTRKTFYFQDVSSDRNPEIHSGREFTV